MNGLDEYVGKNIYLTGYMHEKADEVGKACFTVYTSEEKCLTALGNTPAALLGEVSVLNGIVTKAMSIPNEMPNNVDIFVLLPLALADELTSIVIKCASIEYLQKVIAYLMTKETMLADDDDDYLEEFSDLDTQDIENVYILYGEEIELYYTFPDSVLDEEIFETSKKIYNEIKETQE